MAGYIGSKSSVTQVDGYNRTEADAEFVNDPNSVITVSGSNVGIGTSSPSEKLTVAVPSNSGGALFYGGTQSDRGLSLSVSNAGGFDNSFWYLNQTANNSGSTLAFGTRNAEAMRIDSSGNLLVGTSTSPSAASVIQVLAGVSGRYTQWSNTSTGGGWVGSNGGGGGAGQLEFGTYSGAIGSETYSERMRIDSSGNLLVGKTSAGVANEGAALTAAGYLEAARDDGTVGYFNRLSTDGNLMDFRKDGTTVGSIGAVGGSTYVSGSTNGVRFLGARVQPCNTSGSLVDNVMDLGFTTSRFDDIYATNGTIQTSDRNEKQDIEVLSEAETRVAQACKGLLRKFRWQDAVAEKGDDARIHFGIIAQDLQDAFAAEGLDAGRYAMFISSTWWETQTDVPAVEAVAEVLDDDGNVVTEAVEAKEAYTRTDTYETQAEAPEGATERTRLGVRYPELLAFIIGAM